jgi:hypothetical protein
MAHIPPSGRVFHKAVDVQLLRSLSAISPACVAPPWLADLHRQEAVFPEVCRELSGEALFVAL